MADYKFIFRYGFTSSYLETPLERVGVSDLLAITDIEYHDESNSVYVSWAGDDGSPGDGTKTNPYRTIQYAKDNLISDQYIITIMDDNYYYTGDAIDLFFDVDAIVIQGMEGHKPVLRLDTNIASQQIMLRLQNDGKIINVEIQAPTGYSEQVMGIDARDGEARYVTIDGMNDNGIHKTTSGTVDINNTIIKNCVNDATVDGNGILIEEGTVNLDHVLIYGCDYAGVYIIGSGSKTVTLDHCTIADNQYGGHVLLASNLTMTIDNSILSKNRIYDFYGSTATFSYACVGKVNGSPTYTGGTPILRINPLFIAEGDYDLRSKYNGYGDNVMTSPCVGVSSTGTDLGCYEYSRSLSGEDYIQFSITPPQVYTENTDAVDGRVIVVKAVKPVQVLKGLLNKLTLSWQGQDNVLTNDEKVNLGLMYEDDSPYIYVSEDEGVTYIKYMIDKSRGKSVSRALMKDDNDYYIGTQLNLIKV